MITATSIIRLKKKTGIVIFVGNAARFVTNDMVIAAMTKAQRTILFPEIITKNKLRGVIMQPCPATMAANQPRRYFSWD